MFKLKYFILPFILLLSFTELKATEFDAIEDGKQFRRTKAGSPIYLEKRAAIVVENYGLKLKRSGFIICEFDGGKKVGYITPTYKPQDKIVELSWVFINEADRGKGYSTEALRTVEAICKYLKSKGLLAGCDYLYLTMGTDNAPMKKAAITAGYEPTERIWSPPGLMFCYEKRIG